MGTRVAFQSMVIDAVRCDDLFPRTTFRKLMVLGRCFYIREDGKSLLLFGSHPC